VNQPNNQCRDPTDRPFAIDILFAEVKVDPAAARRNDKSKVRSRRIKGIKVA
jgi:hypothetical protein